MFFKKSRSKSHLGRSWGDLGAVLGRSWAVLGPSWGGLGPSWQRLGTVLEAPRGQDRFLRCPQDRDVRAGEGRTYNTGGVPPPRKLVNKFTSELVNKFTSEYS